MKTLLITGGAGFIGSNFVRYIYQKYFDYHIIVLDALTHGGSEENLPNRGNDNCRLELWQGNVANSDIVDALVARADIIIHFAAETHVTRSIYDNLEFFKTDVIGTQVVANAAVKYKERIKKFIHISSSEIYDTQSKTAIAEDRALNPPNPYAAAKFSADRLIYSYAHTYSLPAVILRPFNVYGPYQHLEKVIPRFITSCLLQEPLTIHGKGEEKKDYMHVDDFCVALDKVLHEDRVDLRGQEINLGSGECISIFELAQAVAKIILQQDFKIEFLKQRSNTISRSVCNPQKAKKLLNWQTNIELMQGLRNTIQWYGENQRWWDNKLSYRAISIVDQDGNRKVH